MAEIEISDEVPFKDFLIFLYNSVNSRRSSMRKMQLHRRSRSQSQSQPQHEYEHEHNSELNEPEPEAKSTKSTKSTKSNKTMKFMKSSKSLQSMHSLKSSDKTEILATTTASGSTISHHSEHSQGPGNSDRAGVGVVIHRKSTIMTLPSSKSMAGVSKSKVSAATTIISKSNAANELHNDDDEQNQDLDLENVGNENASRKQSTAKDEKHAHKDDLDLGDEGREDGDREEQDASAKLSTKSHKTLQSSKTYKTDGKLSTKSQKSQKSQSHKSQKTLPSTKSHLSRKSDGELSMESRKTLRTGVTRSTGRSKSLGGGGQQDVETIDEKSVKEGLNMSIEGEGKEEDDLEITQHEGLLSDDVDVEDHEHHEPKANNRSSGSTNLPIVSAIKSVGATARTSTKSSSKTNSNSNTSQKSQKFHSIPNDSKSSSCTSKASSSSYRESLGDFTVALDSAPASHKTNKSNKTNKTIKSIKSVKSDKSMKSDKTNKTHKSSVVAESHKSLKSLKSHKSVKSIKNHIPKEDENENKVEDENGNPEDEIAQDKDKYSDKDTHIDFKNNYDHEAQHKCGMYRYLYVNHDLSFFKNFSATTRSKSSLAAYILSRDGDGEGENVDETLRDHTQDDNHNHHFYCHQQHHHHHHQYVDGSNEYHHHEMYCNYFLSNRRSRSTPIGLDVITETSVPLRSDYQNHAQTYDNFESESENGNENENESEILNNEKEHKDPQALNDYEDEHEHGHEYQSDYQYPTIDNIHDNNDHTDNHDHHRHHANHSIPVTTTTTTTIISAADDTTNITFSGVQILSTGHVRSDNSPENQHQHKNQHKHGNTEEDYADADVDVDVDIDKWDADDHRNPKESEHPEHPEIGIELRNSIAGSGSGSGGKTPHSKKSKPSLRGMNSKSSPALNQLNHSFEEEYATVISPRRINTSNPGSRNKRTDKNATTTTTTVQVTMDTTSLYLDSVYVNMRQEVDTATAARVKLC